MNCLFCDKISIWAKENSPFLIKEFKNTFLIVGDHQTFKGYCVLIQKKHVVEFFDNSIDIQHEVLKELSLSVSAIQKAFPCNKINLSNYGNMTPHQHWHIFPRSTTDKNWPQPPWTLMETFPEQKTSELDANHIKNVLLKYL